MDEVRSAFRDGADEIDNGAPYYAAVCVYPNLFGVAKKFLGDSGVKVASGGHSIPDRLDAAKIETVARVRRLHRLSAKERDFPGVSFPSSAVKSIIDTAS